MVGSIMGVGELTHCTLLHFTSYLKAAQMKVWCSLIQELMFY